MSGGTGRRPPLAVVVGCGGIGMACARALGRDHRLVLVDVDQDALRRSITALDAEGHVAASVVCDITEEASVRRLAAELPPHGEIAALAHVAGLAPSYGNWRSILQVNAVGAARVADRLAAHMSIDGAAVFVSSLGGHLFVAPEDVEAVLDDPLQEGFLDALAAAAPGLIDPSTAYGWSKIALMSMCRRLAAAWGAAGVRINSISPGLIASPMGAREFANEPRKAAMLQRTPLARQGSMVEVAELVSFLCSRRAGFITGTDILIDGGLAAVLGQPSRSRSADRSSEVAR